MVEDCRAAGSSDDKLILFGTIFGFSGACNLRFTEMRSSSNILANFMEAKKFRKINQLHKIKLKPDKCCSEIIAQITKELNFSFSQIFLDQL